MGLSDDITATIRIYARDFASAEFRKLQGEIKAVGAEGAAASAGGLKSFGAAASMVGVGVGAATVATAAFAVHLAGDFESAMSKVHGFAGASSSDMAYYRQSILAADVQLGVSATHMAQGLYYVISAGYKGRDAMNVLNWSTKAAAASGADMVTVADAVTTALKAYHMS